MNTTTKACSLLLFAAALAGGAGLVRAGAFADVPPGLRVDGRVVDGKAPGPWLEELRRRIGAREVTIAHEGTYRRVSLAELGVEVDVAALLEAVRAASAGSVSDRLTKLADARAGNIDLP